MFADRGLAGTGRDGEPLLMAAAALLIVAVAASEVGHPTTGALVATAEHAMPNGIAMRLLPVPNPAMLDTIRVERDLDAHAVITLIWERTPRASRAFLRLHLAHEDRWFGRVIPFAPADSDVERGRTLGFAIASIWPDGVFASPSARRPTERPSGPEAKPPKAAAALAPASVPTADSDSPWTDLDPSLIPPTPAAQASRASHDLPLVAVAEPERLRSGAGRQAFAFGLAATAATGLGGPARGLGGAAEVLWRPFAHLGLRATLALRTGSVPELPGEQRVGAVGTGGEYWFADRTREPRWNVGLRADALFLAHRVRAQNLLAGPASESHGRWVPAADASLRSVVRLTGALELTFGGGVEVAFGRTEIRAGLQRITVATVPPWRLIADVGLRYPF